MVTKKIIENKFINFIKMILQYFKKKENKYKKIADKIYLSILLKSKDLIKNNFFKELNFDSSFEITSIILIFYIKIYKDKKSDKHKIINELLIQNFVDDLDKTMREMGIGDMSIGKYVKKYVKKFYFRIKSIDPILAKYDKEILANYLNSIKLIDEKYTRVMVDQLTDIYEKIKRNEEIV